MCLKFGENEVLLPEDKSAVLKEGGYDGKHVFMGIRPEDMEIAGSKKEEEKVCIRHIRPFSHWAAACTIFI